MFTSETGDDNHLHVVAEVKKLMKKHTNYKKSFKIKLLNQMFMKKINFFN